MIENAEIRLEFEEGASSGHCVFMPLDPAARTVHEATVVGKQVCDRFGIARIQRGDVPLHDGDRLCFATFENRELPGARV